ncbi:MAG: pseudouridine synthase [Planctomycetota bacterium]|nr:pseudouridine synthase [Planctomycetota bacterium]
MKSSPTSTNREKAGPQEKTAPLSGEQRLNKLLAAAGLGARRQVDELIEQGRVEVDGKIVEQFGMKVDASVAKITVDGTPLKKLRPAYFALHKPTGVLCTNRDPQGRSRAIDMVPGHERLFPVGRLDASSVGLLLLTNDGELAQQLTHPKYGVPKTYYVVVAGQIEPDEMKRLRRGIYLSDGVARVDFVKIKKVRKGSTELEITLSEGKNREIRRVLARLGHKVVTLRRLSIGPLKLGAMPVGAYRPLTKDEVVSLYRAADDAKKARRQRKETNEERDLEREQRVAAKEAKRALAGEPVEPSTETKSAASRTSASKLGGAKAAGARSRQPMKEVVDRTRAKKKTKDPFDWDDDELLLASPFAANHPSAGSDEADDDDDGWVTPLMAGMNEDDDDDMPGMSFHQRSIESDAILLRDGGNERIGDVIDYESDEETDYESDEGEADSRRPARQSRGRGLKKSPKQPAKRPVSRGGDSRSGSDSDTPVRYSKSARSTERPAARSTGRATSSKSRSDSSEGSFGRTGFDRSGVDDRGPAGRKKGSKKFTPGKRASAGSRDRTLRSSTGGRSSTSSKKSSAGSGRDRSDETSFNKSTFKKSGFKKSGAKRSPAVKKGGPRSGATTKRSSFKKSSGKRSKR